MATIRRTPSSSPIPNIFRDLRVLQIVGQIIFAIVLIIAIYALITSIMSALAARNLRPNFSFLETTGGFDLSEAPDWYSSGSNYWAAFQVGVINTLRVVILGLVLSTVLGIFLGIFLLSNNWIVRTISRVYVEILRNTPLLVQLFAWYFIVMFSLPVLQQSLTFPQESMSIIPFRIILYGVLALVVWRYQRRQFSASSRGHVAVAGLAAFVVAIEIAFWLSRSQPDWSLRFGSGAITTGFLVYGVVSLLLIAATRLLPALRALAQGAAVGQLLGGLVFHFGLLPTNALRFEMHPAVYINIRGFVFPEFLASARFAEWLAFVAVGVALAIAAWVFIGYRNDTTDGKRYPRLWYSLAALLGFAVAGWLIVSSEPAPPTIPVEQEGQIVNLPVEDAVAQDLLTVREAAVYSQSPLLVLLPQRQGLRFATGTQISPEYMAILLGLVVYTSVFIAEIVRAGIQAVPKGQVEAARALGLGTGQVLRLVILPQALRVIIPPLGNQYLNLTKNSSLATAVAFADIYTVSITMASTSGQSVPIILMVMVTYLIMSLTIATIMSRVNQQFQLVTR